uniref:Uncharacterized protein n=1 Tax=Anguilla anguilla TaxID=7936 RepID=A0A0E9VTZ9_ANGAN
MVVYSSSALQRYCTLCCVLPFCLLAQCYGSNLASDKEWFTCDVSHGYEC